MSDLKIPELPTGFHPVGPELAAADQDGQTRQFTVEQLRDALTTELHIYVHRSVGSDSNDGLTPDTPVYTLARAYELVPRVLAAPVVIHMSSGVHPYSTPPNIMVLTPDAHIWWVGDGAGDPGDDPYDDVTSGIVATVVDGGRGCISDISIAADDDYVALQVVFTDSITGDRVGLEAAVRRTIAVDDTIEWSGDTNCEVGDEFTLRRSACIIEAAYSEPDQQDVILGHGPFRRNRTTYGYRNLTIRSGKPNTTDAHLITANTTDLTFYGVQVQGFRFDTKHVVMACGSGFANDTVLPFREHTAGLTVPVVQGVGEQHAWSSNGLQAEGVNPAGDFGNYIIFAWDTYVIGNLVWGIAYISRQTFYSAFGRCSALYLADGAVWNAGGSEGVLVDGENASGSVIFVGTPSTLNVRTSRIEFTNRGTGHAIDASGGQGSTIRIATAPLGGAQGAGARAIYAAKGCQVVTDVALVATGGTAGEDIEVEGETVIDNATLTADSAVINANAGTRVYRTA